MSQGWNQAWEEQLYGQGRHMNRYPFEIVVRELLSHFPEPSGRHILEVGCGAGNNIWFAAREGFRAAGIDGSESAVQFARERLRADGLEADLRVGDFGKLPWETGCFDAVLDRKSITHNRLEHVTRSLEEVARVLTSGGLFVSEVYSSAHPEASRGRDLGDGARDDFPTGSYFEDVGLTLFFSEDALREALAAHFELIKLEHVVMSNHLSGGAPRTAFWQVAARKR